MGASSRSSIQAEKDLSERQRYWLKHLRAAAEQGESLKAYARRQGLSDSSLYEAKRGLRACGLIAAARPRKGSTPGFVPVAVSDPVPVAASLRVRLSSGALLEWSEAPQGDALRELIGLVS